MLICTYVQNLFKNIVVFAVKQKFKIKGFITVETLTPNNRSGIKNAQTLDGKNFNLTPNKSIIFLF